MCIGGWGCESVVRPPPNREIDFGFVCVACVRACERSCVSAMTPQWLGLILCDFPGVCPSVQVSIQIKSSSSVSFDRCFGIAIGH